MKGGGRQATRRLDLSEPISWGRPAHLRELAHAAARDGKSFRHEKTKKKRGSYRGGLITMASNSYKFDD